MKFRLNVRVIVSEQQKFSIDMPCHTNFKVGDVAKEIGEQIDQSKYELSFFYKGECLSLSTKFGEKNIGLG